MILTWMLYATLVALILSAAGLALERVAGDHRQPSRWIWAAVLAGSFLLPAAALIPGDAAAGPPASPWSAADALEEASGALAVGGTDRRSGAFSGLVATGGAWLSAARSRLTPRSWTASLPAVPAHLDPLAAAGWLALSLLVGAALLRAFLTLGRERRDWRAERVDGRNVLVSEALGPAVVGVLRPAIVVPRWVLDLPAEDRELMLRHEEEHRRAGDAPLLLSAFLVLVLLPWNLPLWWQVRRLRLAVEVDCDRRVLGPGPDLRRYASLLVEMGRRGTFSRLSALALAHPEPFLERRIRTMTTRTRPRYLRSAALVLTAGLLAAAAYQVEEPAPAAFAAAEIAEPQDVGSGSTDIGRISSDAGRVSSQVGRASTDLGRMSVELGRISTEVGPVSTGAGRVGDPVGRISGRVSDAATGAPLEDVQIFLVDTEIAGISRQSGVYLITNVPAGTYELRAEGVGLTPFAQEVTVQDGATVEVNIEMTARALTREERAALELAERARQQQEAGRITGSVRDAVSGEPVSDVQVYLVGASLGAITRQTGQYLMANVPPGTYQIRAERICMTPLTREITIARGSTMEEDFRMTAQSSCAQMEQVRAMEARATEQMARLTEEMARLEREVRTASAERQAELRARYEVLLAEARRAAAAQASGTGVVTGTAGEARRRETPSGLTPGRVTGRVSEAGTGAPLADVQVFLVGADIGAVTRQTGQYLIASVPPGTYVLQAERLGLRPVTRQITVTEGATIEINLQLGPGG